MLNFPLIIFPVLLSGLVAARDCNKDEECVLASNCTQYTEDSEDLGFLPVNSEAYDVMEKGLDEQICAINKRTGEEKVCCKEEVELDEQEVSGGSRLEEASAGGGTIAIDGTTIFNSCSSRYSCQKRNKAGRKFCCRPHIKRGSGDQTCRGARRCYAQ